MEKIVSPGVFTSENDLSYLPTGIGDIGAAVIGPTVKGPAMVPTQVTSYSEYIQVFGEIYESGSNSYQFMTSHLAKEYLKNARVLTVVRILSGSYSPASASMASSASNTSFDIYTMGDGIIANSSCSEDSNGILESGSVDNVRWEITGLNENKGTFTLLVRRGNDSTKRKVVLETWNNLSLDPNASNYISKIIGDMKPTYEYNAGDPYIDMSGSFENKSKYIRVTNITNTINYLDEAGNIRDTNATGSLPIEASGSIFGGTDGDLEHPMTFYDDITADDSQGYIPTSCTEYTMAVDLLSNQDEYDINMIFTPGVLSGGSGTANTLVDHTIDMVEARGDCLYIFDTKVKDTAALSSVVADAEAYDSSYAATYWPWVQIRDNTSNNYRWVPPSVVMAGVYAYNDKAAFEWFAPAGLNRGGIESAIRTSRKLTHSNRDTLYESNINSLASFPNTNVVSWGQKTLQKKASALDRINVRRLLINLKKYIASTSKYLVFEQNTESTRKRFLNIVNPYMQSVKQNQGLYRFEVVMDETNNTADVIDRNILKGDIYIQPTRTAEFIVIDFNVLPTGATFGA